MNLPTFLYPNFQSPDPGDRPALPDLTSLFAGQLRRLQHIRGVVRQGGQVADQAPAHVSRYLLSATTLHDIGYARRLKDTGFHPLDGARWASQQGLPAPLVEAIFWHSGAGREARLRGGNVGATYQQAPEPQYPQLIDWTTYCDLHTGPTGAPVSPEKRLTEIQERYPAEHVVHRFVQQEQSYLLTITRRVQAQLEDQRP